jgi:hypothetical protein
MLLLTGPTAAGKNTVGFQLAKRQLRCAVVDFDAVRAMFVQPHHAPWQGEEGKAQQLLGVRHVCQLARGFSNAGWKVIVLDVVSDETAPIYREELKFFNLQIIQLLPKFNELERRFNERGPVLTKEELKAVYQGQIDLKNCDKRIDNTHLSVTTTVEQIAAYVGEFSV